MDFNINTRLVMKIKNFFLVLFMGVIYSMTSQIGIGTNSPQATFDVAGTVRITDLPIGTTDEISPTGSTANKTLNKTGLGANLIVTDNSLTTAPVSGTVGDFDLGPLSGGNIQNLDLGLATGSYNSRSTFIRVHSYTLGTNIAGITDGVDGRHVAIYFSEPAGISILEDSPLAQPQNRIKTASTSQLSISGEGFIDFVYDADAGADGLGRWIVIKFRG
jgi:hypothetical protein